ncbi:MAG: hypothetical protein GY835_00560 [bacterium]|nr:hypothetical protein [bacterium]
MRNTDKSSTDYTSSDRKRAIRQVTDREVQRAVKNMQKSRARAHRLGTRSAAIRAYCIECVGGESAEVRCCTATDCLLYPFRMGRKLDDTPKQEGHHG